MWWTVQNTRVGQIINMWWPVEHASAGYRYVVTTAAVWWPVRLVRTDYCYVVTNLQHHAAMWWPVCHAVVCGDRSTVPRQILAMRRPIRCAKTNNKLCDCVAVTWDMLSSRCLWRKWLHFGHCLKENIGRFGEIFKAPLFSGATQKGGELAPEGQLTRHPLLRMSLWWSLCTLSLHACQVRVTEGDLGLCCVCLTSFKHKSTSLCVDFAWVLLGLMCHFFFSCAN